jgi:kinetochore protein Nuf2
MAATTEQSRQTVASNESKSRALQGKLDQLAIIEQDVRSALDLMNAIEGEQARLDEALSRLTAMRSEKDSKLALSRELKGEAQVRFSSSVIPSFSR